MKRTNLLRLLAILFAFALIAAACGDDDDDGATGDDSSQTDDGGDTGDDGGDTGDDGGDTGDDGGDTGDDGGDTGDDGGDTGDDGGDAGGELTVPDNPDEGVSSDTIKVGWMGDITGPTASFQSFGNHGSVAYIECLNERGGLLGRQIELISEDDQFGAEQGQINYTKLVDDDNVLTILYMGNTAIAEALLPDVEDANISVIGPPQTTDALAASPNFFTNLAHYGDQADMIVPEMADRVGGAENMVVFGISFEVPSGREFAAYVEQEVTEAGGTYTDTVYTAPTATEVTAQIVALQEAIDNEGVNVVTLHSSPGVGALVIQSMVDAGITDVQVGGIHGVAVNAFYENAPAEFLPNVFAVHSFLPANNDIEGAAEMTRCAELAGFAGEELNINFAHGFLNGYILEQAILRAAEDSGELTRESLNAALMGEFDTLGITCPIDWSEVTHSPCGAAFTVDDTGLVPVNPFEFYQDSFDLEYGVEVS